MTIPRTPCNECGKPARGNKCRTCWTAARVASGAPRVCSECGGPTSRPGAKKCIPCFQATAYHMMRHTNCSSCGVLLTEENKKLKSAMAKCDTCLRAMKTDRARKDYQDRPRLQVIAAAKKLGLDTDEVGAYYDDHDGACDSCGGGPTGRYHRPVIDHCHRTGEFRGFLCNGCNLAAGYLDDDPRKARALAVYLEGTIDGL